MCPNSLPWKPSSMDQSRKQEQAAQDFPLFVSFLNETSVYRKRLQEGKESEA